MRVSVRHIQEAVAEHFEVPISAMTTRKRTKDDDPEPRHVAMFFARRITGKSYLTIARIFRRKDHTTVIYAMRKIERLCAENDAFAAEIKHLSQAIGSGQSLSPEYPEVGNLVSSVSFSQAA
jgi:chromosomal replication initiator protein